MDRTGASVEAFVQRVGSLRAPESWIEMEADSPNSFVHPRHTEFRAACDRARAAIQRSGRGSYAANAHLALMNPAGRTIVGAILSACPLDGVARITRFEV